MRVKQRALTVLVPLLSGSADKVTAILDGMGGDLEKHSTLRLRESAKTHFARFVVVAGREGFKDQLLFTSNYDGNEREYIKELVETCGDALDEIFRNCRGYSAGDAQSPARFTAFVRQFSKKPRVFFVSLPGLTVETIKNEGETSAILEGIIDKLGSAPFARLWELAGISPPPHRSRRSPRNPAFVDRFLEWIVGIDKTGPNPNTVLPIRHPASQLEDVQTQNALTVFAPIKKDIKSWIIVRAVLFFGRLYFLFRPPWGSLSGVTSIHFARWVLVDGGGTLMFESNYDGSFDSYIDNFVDVTSGGLNGIWANCQDFPRRGCKDIDGFKEIIRKRQVRVPVFHSAYRNLTVKNIIANHTVGAAVQGFINTPDIDRVLAGSYEIND